MRILLLSALLSTGIFAGDLPPGAEALWITSEWKGGGYAQFSPDGNLLGVTDHDNIHLFDLKERTRRFHTRGRNRLAFSPDSKLVVCNVEGLTAHLVVVDLAGQTELKRPGGPGETAHFAFDPGGKFLLGGGSGSAIHYWDTATWETRAFATNKTRTDRICGMAISPDSRFVASTNGGVLALHDLQSAEQYFRSEESGLKHNVCFSPDGGTICVQHTKFTSQGGDKWQAFLQFWSVADKKMVKEFETSQHGANPFIDKLAYTPDGLALGYLDEGTLSFLDPATGSKLCTIPGAHTSFDLSPDQRWLATCSAGSKVIVWDFAFHVLGGPPPATLAAAEMPAQFALLSNSDPAKAYKAVWLLSRGGDAVVPFLKAKFKFATKNASAIGTFMKNLGHNAEGMRSLAIKELKRFGPLIEPELKEALAKNPTDHLKREATALLQAIEAAPVPPVEAGPEKAQRIKALHVLFLINTDATHKLLEEISWGSASPRECWEARQLLKRLKRVSLNKP